MAIGGVIGAGRDTRVTRLLRQCCRAFARAGGELKPGL